MTKKKKYKVSYEGEGCCDVKVKNNKIVNVGKFKPKSFPYITIKKNSFTVHYKKKEKYPRVYSFSSKEDCVHIAEKYARINNMEVL